MSDMSDRPERSLCPMNREPNRRCTIGRRARAIRRISADKLLLPRGRLEARPANRRHRSPDHQLLPSVHHLTGRDSHINQNVTKILRHHPERIPVEDCEVR